MIDILMIIHWTYFVEKNIQSLILKAGDYVNYQPNYYGPNMKLKNFYGNSRMNWMRHHGTIKCTPANMNSVLVEK